MKKPGCFIMLKRKKTVKNAGRGDDHGNQEGYNVMIL